MKTSKPSGPANSGVDLKSRSPHDAQASAVKTGKRRTFGETYKLIGGAQKAGAGVPAYTRWVNRRLARFVAVFAFTLGWSANVVTFVSAGLSLAAICLLVTLPPTIPLGIAAAFLFAAGYVFDSADGQVARLSGSAGPAGEWLDHVVDAIRSPAIHLAVLVSLSKVDGVDTWVLGAAIGFTLLTSGQFMSQILAEQLASRGTRKSSKAGIAQSLILLPTDTGTLCWIFILWGMPIVFSWVYVVLFLLNLVHAGISMRRKYTHLRSY